VKHGYTKEWINSHIAELVAEGYERKEAVAIALDEARKEYRAWHPHGVFPAHLRLKPNRPRGYKKNPSLLNSQVQQAAQLFEDFSGHEAENAERVTVPENPKVAIAIGEVEAIIYNTVRDGKRERYIHKFTAKSRPTFGVSYDGKQLLMIGGSYDFTEKGIEDR
jgi:hypothetical protein